MKYLYIAYQYLIAFPFLWIWTMLVALITILFFPIPNAYWLNRLQAVWARMFCWLMFIPVTVSGEENIKKGQSYVFVANHQSMFDIWMVYGWLPVIFKWLMKKELRKIPLVGTACKAVGHIYIDRSSPGAARESLKVMEKALRNGISTVIFPEGTRSANGEVGKFKRGAFQIAADLNLPVIPISLSGCYEVMKKGAPYVTRHPIHMHIGEPISPELFDKDHQTESIEMVREIIIKNMKQW